MSNVLLEVARAVCATFDVYQANASCAWREASIMEPRTLYVEGRGRTNTHQSVSTIACHCQLIGDATHPASRWAKQGTVDTFLSQVAKNAQKDRKVTECTV